MGMSIDELRQECKYCYREIDASGLEAFRCTNKTVNMETSWCRPKNANEPCSICEYCEPREEIGMTIDEAIEYNKNLEMYMKISDEQEPCKFLEENHIALSMAIDTMRKYQQLQADYEARLKADMVAMLTEIQLEIGESTVENEEYRNSHVQNGIRLGKHLSKAIIQDKIDALKENKDGKDN